MSCTLPTHRPLDNGFCFDCSRKARHARRLERQLALAIHLDRGLGIIENAFGTEVEWRFLTIHRNYQRIATRHRDPFTGAWRAWDFPFIAGAYSTGADVAEHLEKREFGFGFVLTLDTDGGPVSLEV